MNANSHDGLLAHTSAAQSCVSVEIGHFLIFLTHHIHLMHQMHISKRTTSKFVWRFGFHFFPQKSSKSNILMHGWGIWRTWTSRQIGKKQSSPSSNSLWASNTAPYNPLLFLHLLKCDWYLSLSTLPTHTIMAFTGVTASFCWVQRRLLVLKLGLSQRIPTFISSAKYLGGYFKMTKQFGESNDASKN